MSDPKQIVFKWEFALGHVIQIVVMVGASMGIWYGLVADVERNRLDIEINQKAIVEIRESAAETMRQVDDNAERREARMMKYMGEIKQDVSWLVRREADRQGK